MSSYIFKLILQLNKPLRKPPEAHTHSFPVPIGVGDGIGVGIDPDSGFSQPAHKLSSGTFNTYRCSNPSALSINIFSMSNLNDHNDNFVVIDFINDAIFTLPHPISLLTGKPLGSFRSRFFRQRINGRQDFSKVPVRDSTHIPGNGFTEKDFIFSHSS
jgi:hypothetical protein